MDFIEYLKILVQKFGSYRLFSVDAPPAAKFDGILKSLQKETLNKERIKEYAYNLMDTEQQAHFERIPEMNLALAEPGISHFRVNIFKQRNNLRHGYSKYQGGNSRCGSIRTATDTQAKHYGKTRTHAVCRRQWFR